MTTETTTIKASENTDDDIYKYQSDFFIDFSNFKITEKTEKRYRAITITQFKELMDSTKTLKEYMTLLDVFSIGGKWAINTIAIVNNLNEITHIITGGKPRDGMIRTHVESAIVTKRNDFKVYSTLDTLLREFYPLVNRRRIILSFDLRDQLLGNSRAEVQL